MSDNTQINDNSIAPDSEWLLPSCSRVFVRDYGHLVMLEYRIGPEITCEAVAIKCPDGWIIDGIETLPTWRCHGHARAVLERIVEISGMPVRAVEIYPGAEDFWAHMTELGINFANSHESIIIN